LRWSKESSERSAVTLYVIDSPTSNGTVRFEVAYTSNTEGEVEAVKPQDALKKVKDALGEAGRTIKAISEQVAEYVSEMQHKPEELEVEFGVKVDGEFGAVVATLGSGAHLSVKLRWKAS
jgi:hypothetical protein